MNVVVIDYQMGNLGSVRRAFEQLGASVVVSDDPVQMDSADRLILPGVGAFGDGMAHLRESGWDEGIRSAAARGIPVLGICLGMQLLADRGFEGGENKGLGLVPGEVRILEPQKSEERIPHVGWNEVYPRNEPALLNGIARGTDFYFVHSYHFVPQDDSVVFCKTPYCGGFVSGVVCGSVWGVQFHPEKSSKPGFQLLRNFLSL